MESENIQALIRLRTHMINKYRLLDGKATEKDRKILTGGK